MSPPKLKNAALRGKSLTAKKTAQDADRSKRFLIEASMAKNSSALRTPDISTTAKKTDKTPIVPPALGTSRTLSVDTSNGYEVGLRFGRKLPLADKEVVLTFDDGPSPKISEKVRKALKAENIRATFFLVGKNAKAYPGFVRKLAADGHTIATHTWSHMYLSKKSMKTALDQIDSGIVAVNAALKKIKKKAAPFFRFPGLESNRALRSELKKRGIGAIDIDMEGGDWIRGNTSQDVYNRVVRQLKAKRRGVILLHDIQPRTAAMLPDFLRYLKKNGYKVVNLAPKLLKQKIFKKKSNKLQSKPEAKPDLNSSPKPKSKSRTV